MHTPSAVAAKPLPKRTRSTAGLEEIDAWLGQITSSATSTTSSTTASPAVTSMAVHETPFVSTLGASRKRHHSLPAAAIAGSLQSLAPAPASSSSGLPLKDKSAGSGSTRRPELALFAGDNPHQHQDHQTTMSRPFSNQYSPSLHHDDAHTLDTASYAFLPSSSHHDQEMPTSTDAHSYQSQSHQNHALPPPLQLPEMSPREDFLVRAFVSDAMKLEGGGHEGDEGSQSYHAFPLLPSSSSSCPSTRVTPQRSSLEIPTTPTMDIHGRVKDISTTPTSTATTMLATTPMTPSAMTGSQQHHKWTREEDEKLRDAVSRFGGKSWKLIAEMLGNGRTDVQCLHRWNKVLKPGLVKGPWTPEEDRVLLGLIARYGVGQIRWCDVALHLPGRIGKQCRERWCNHLDSSIRKGQWTPQEDDTVFRLQQTIGNKWSEIAKHLPGRTENAVKNRFNSAARRKWLMSQHSASGGVTPLVTATTIGSKAPRGPPAPRGGRLPRASGVGGRGVGTSSGLLSTDLLAGPPRPPPQPPAQSTSFHRGVAFGAMPSSTSFMAAPHYTAFGNSDELPPHQTMHVFHMPDATTTTGTPATPASPSDLTRPAFSFHPGNAFPSSPPPPPAFRPQFLASVSSPTLASLTTLLSEPTQTHQGEYKHTGGFEPHESPYSSETAMDDHDTGAMDPDDDDNQVAHSPSVRRASLSVAGVDKRRLSVDASSVATSSKHDTENDDDDDDASLRAIDLPDSDAEGQQQQDEHEAHDGGGSPVDMDDQNMSTFLDSVALELDDML